MAYDKPFTPESRMRTEVQSLVRAADGTLVNEQDYFDARYAISRDVFTLYGANPAVTFTTGAPMTFDYQAGTFYGLLNTAPGPNQALWLGEAFAGDDTGDVPFAQPPHYNFWNRPSIADSIFWNDANDSATPDQISGIAIGSCAVAILPAQPTQAVIALYARWDNLTWELRVAQGRATQFGVSGPASPPLVLTGVPPPVLHQQFQLRIVYVPQQYVAGYVSGIEGGRITDTTTFPNRTGTSWGQAGVKAFVQTGTGANANIDSWVSFMRCTTYMGTQ